VLESQSNVPLPLALSSFQFKYMGADSDWYRIGEINMPQRFEEILSVQPDLVELITWNDAGESHYIGNNWPGQIAGSPDIAAYADGFDHSGWQQLVSAFIQAYKSGATSGSQILPPSSSPVGTLWYRTLMTTAGCSSTIANYESAQDTVNFAVVLPSSVYTIKVYSNGAQIGSFDGVKGLNYNDVPGLQPGSAPVLQVYDSSNNLVASATGTKAVSSESSDSSLCNWNYEVVGL
jgi:glucan endo-1,3-alpha-glucosidase